MGGGGSRKEQYVASDSDEEDENDPRYKSQRPSFIDTAAADLPSMSSFNTPVESLPLVAGGDEETSRLLRHCHDLLLPAPLASGSFAADDSLPPQQRRSSKMAIGDIAGAASTPLTPASQRKVFEHFAHEAVGSVTPSGGRPHREVRSLDSPSTPKDKVRASLEMAPVQLVYATPTALIVTWSPAGSNPNDFRPVDEYVLEWRMATDAEVNSGTAGGARRGVRGPKELHAWSAPSSGRWGNTRVSFWCCSTEWRQVPRRALRFFDRSLVVQGLPSRCHPLFFRVRGSANSVFGEFSPVLASVRTFEKLRQPAPRLRPGGGSVTAHSVALEWDPIWHYDKRAAIVYELRCAEGDVDAGTAGGESAGALLYSGTSSYFHVGGAGEVALRPDTAYRFTVSATWIEVDGTRWAIESEPPFVATTPRALRPAAPPPPDAVEIGAQSIRLVFEPPQRATASAFGGRGGEIVAYHLCGGVFGEARTERLYAGPESSVVVGLGAVPDGGGDHEVDEAGASANAALFAARCRALLPNTRYTFCVAAANAYGRGDFSDDFVVRTLGMPANRAEDHVDHDDPAQMARSGAPQDRPVCTVELPHAPGWVECWTMHPKMAACCYYHNAELDVTQWDYPADAPPDNDLEFRHKRFAFLWEVWSQTPPPIAVGDEDGGSAGVFTIKLRRAQLVYDSFRAFHQATPRMLRGRMRLSFEGEDGIDSGGLTKDWFVQVTRALRSASYCLFTPLEEEGEHAHAFTIDKRSTVNEESLHYFRFVGLVLGKAIYDRHTVDLPLSPILYKHMLGLEPDLRDLRTVDPVLCNSLEWMLNNDITGVIDENFTVLEDNFGEMLEVELIPGGARTRVTQSNKHDYVRAVVQQKIGRYGATATQLDHLLGGLEELVPKRELAVFAPPELDLLLNGRPSVDTELLRRTSRCKGGYEDDGGHFGNPTLKLFWEVFGSLGHDETSDLLQFATGASKVPLDGFDPPLTIVRSEHPPPALPTSHTCFNQLVLPSYTTKEEMRERLLFAATNGKGFHRT